MKEIRRIWNEIYGDISDGATEQLEAFVMHLDQVKKEHFSDTENEAFDWYKDAVVYSTYVDLFNKDFNGLKDKLDYLVELGVNCLWLLPILESPMKDAGFDISDYDTVRADLLGLSADADKEEKDAVFEDFVAAAHAKGIKVIFDVAMNHCSNEHEWFQEARKSKDSKYRDYFIWSDDNTRYPDARIIFKGMCESNWEWDDVAGQYFFHRFFDIQPDLNYRNPDVLVAMTDMLVKWKIKGIDGFRADAVPYLWKEDNTICENLPKTHKIVQFFKASLDYLKPGNLLLAEACQPPEQVVEYFGGGSECNAAYHFPVMPRIFRALAEEKGDSVKMVMAPSFTPEIPDICQWFSFLRCHDELTLEMVTPEERRFLFDYYAKEPLWDFRQGEGISARLADLLDRDIRRIKLAYSIMFTLIGTPIIYYGDEFAKGNDKAYYDEMFRHSGYKDSRYLGRGRIDWDVVEEMLGDPESLGYQTYHAIKGMTKERAQHPAFARGTLEFVDAVNEDGSENKHVLAYERSYQEDKVIVIQNLSSKQQSIKGDIAGEQENLVLEPYGYRWITK